MWQAGDHGYALAVYFRDPDDNGVELCWDRPREQWGPERGELDVAAFLAGSEAEERACSDADGIAAALAAAGTEVCFGVPGGGANLDLAGACGRHGIRFVLTHGETAAVIAAGTWGELTRKPGLALCTRGPGLAAALNGIAQAHLDRQPVVIVADGAGFAHPHQRLDHAALVAPAAKGTVTDAADAVAHALAPPWGPVLLDAGGPRQPPIAWPAAPEPAPVRSPPRAGRSSSPGSVCAAPSRRSGIWCATRLCRC